MAKILYFGSSSPGSTTAHRAKALERMGHVVMSYNPAGAITGLLSSHWLNPVHFRTGYRLVQAQLSRWMGQLLSSIPSPDLVIVNSGELLGPACLVALKQLNCPVVLYNNDDPTGGRDGNRFDMLLQSVPYYDLCVVRRKENVEEYKALGAKKVLLVRMSYDEVAHKPFADSSEIPAIYQSDVAFIGTWMRGEKRDEFLLALKQQGIAVSIWGHRWEKSPLWKELKPNYRGGALNGPAYVAAIQGSKLCLGFLSKGNRDLHTRRSVEIPFAGGLLCAERTSEHLEMYAEGTEALFWADAAECAAVCKKMLADDTQREEIRQAGMRRVKALGVGNETICNLIIQASLSLKDFRKPTSSHPFYEIATTTSI
ncbi:glycosyltransferase [Cesiribacter sp. SM1]|uniref:CgeB family protein n=1 Tax=Cesiribacter sp. SM1 TaxID=2861196 RepID=UPI001CD290AD|nr:glycosyltransferase [Cesiribacter sp. SM1]